ncbi:MAG: SDR family oxidoreductase [Bryobacteraceae bacterium]|nr:SDR family oxidoreductase [Solibacteraceae bacterium]MCL4841992.1 SDR family oxidoreductase [Bryobacteraceae bacterium]MCO5351303.1 SDR family oxidoreductase [Bryobacteraceae bacterium]
MNDLFSLDGKVAAVIGGGGVLAGEMARGLAKAGADVAILDFNFDAAQAGADAIAALGRKSLAVKVDAASRADLEAALAAILAEFGKVDILVNAAGINSATPFFDISEEEWHRILDVDLKSVFLACQVFGKQMVESGSGGSVINISSASSGPPLSKVFTYSVAKGGVNQITQFLAREWATQGVRVNAILPGFFPAEQNRKVLTEDRVAKIMGHTPMNRFGDASELVGAAVFLASDKAASFVTGAIIRVDGGYGAMTI